MQRISNFIPVLLIVLSFGIFQTSCKSGTDSNTGSGDAVTLKLNFKPGDKYLYSTQVNQKINSMGMDMDQNMLMEMVYEAASDEGDNKKLTITYEHVMMKNNTPMGTMEYDSKTPGKGEAAMSFMDSLIGKSFSLTVAPNGDIVKVEGLNDLITSMAGTGDDATKAEINNQFSDTAIKLMMQNSFDLYPGKAVKVGETWGKKSQMGFSGINVEVENTYTLKSVANGKATVAITSVMNLPSTDMGGQAGIPMKIEMKGKQEGTMDVDVASGQIVSGKTSQTINGKMTANGQDMPMNIKGDIIISSKKM